MAKEIERVGIPVALITALELLALHHGANRVVKGVAIPHPCGEPEASAEDDLKVRRTIIDLALEALQTEIVEPKVFARDFGVYTAKL
jgi:betaine reductase